VLVTFATTLFTILTLQLRFKNTIVSFEKELVRLDSMGT